ncbi:Helix-loop-helix protein ngn-1 [Caenorhabditis elegans]|uniref:Helix-loop-helix protein ngn-1 n=1 Tax=Caenorhabditis elegans TaxID=6239 RepID=NGN1_CAEEL|nr:Helix-loop-helix protein ngn-1 [Caenorhabditis elegans]Q95XG7.1 RecName: Full=Helix-loop-helix protein ngn-1 [Caenorhabditis elegans]CCD74131.1 Helix-loop-helix protein ngn-1 [Caenorhabditis elegans]|eukprot:NP_500236.1 NeuroGeNin [Caenorhabditis elegans]
MYHHSPFYPHHLQTGEQDLDMERENDMDQNSKNSTQKPVKREKRRYRCRKRSPATIERAKTVRRDKANARERRRMNSLNDALEHLRGILPALPDEPKMTKIETLRKAQEYIASLSFQLSGGSPDSSQCCETGSCGLCSASQSLQSTPFQSPCFPQPLQYPSSYSNPPSQMYYHHHHQSPSFPHH